MNKDKHIPQGYKDSPLGIIPKEWEVKRLGDIAIQIGDGIHGTPEYIDDSDYYFINGNNLCNGKIIITESTRCVSYSEFVKYKKNLTQDTILLSINGTIGNIALYNDENVMLGKSAAFITISNRKYFYYLLQSNRILVGFEKELTGSTIRNLSLDSIRNTKILLPPQTEIEGITKILYLWDTAIEKQSELIEKLTLRKRALMQQLLTGKKRLPGFSGEWKEVRLGDVASINRGGSPRPIEDYITKGEGYNWIKIGDVNKDAKYITSTEEKIIKEGLSKTIFVRRGDFILSNSMSFGRPYILKIDGCIHDGWLVIQEYGQTFNIDFLYYILGYDTTLAQYKSMAAGSGVLNLNKEIVKEVQLKIPSIEEQIAIASILVNADKEIEKQKQKLSNLQEQKRGLMQVLLTGKKRV